MDIRQLNAIVAIAEHGSFSAAADALATVQSNVSTHIKKLETELGTVLIDRMSGELTDEGRVVVMRARRVIRELDAISSDVTALNAEVVGTVRLGTIGTAARWLVPKLLEIAPMRHPRMHLVFVEATALGLDAQLATGQVDLAVLNLPASGTEVRTVALFEEDLVLVVPMGHPLALHDEVHIGELSDQPLILPLEGVKLRADIDQVAEMAGVTLHPKAEMDSLRLISSLTFEGAGLSILPSGAIPAYLLSQFKLLPISGLRPRIVGVAQRRRGLPGAPVRAVLELLAEIVTDLSAIPQGVRPLLRATNKTKQAQGEHEGDPSKV